MKKYPVTKIRNIGLFSHGGAGKTSLAEAMIFSSGAIKRLGRVEDGNTVSDWDPDEVKRTMSISTSVIPIEWNDHKLNILDTPGYADFAGEMIGASSAVDSAVIVIDASAGVEVGTENTWGYAAARNIPRLIVVNKIDRDNADFDSSLDAAQSTFGPSVVPYFIPIGTEQNFHGVVDVLRERAYLFNDSTDGAYEEAPIPDELLDAVETYRIQLVEAIAENDEELMMKYLEDEELTHEELLEGLRQGFKNQQISPVVVTAASTNRGVNLLLDTLLSVTPEPAPALALDDEGNPIELTLADDEPAVLSVWKTVADPFVGKISFFRVMAGTVASDCHLWNTTCNEDERVAQIFAMRGKEQITVDELGPGDIGAVTKLAHTQTGDTLCDAARKVRIEPVAFPEPMFAASVSPQTKADLDKMGQALARLAEEDPTISISRDPVSAETIISGLGESHVQIALDRMSRKFGVNVTFELPSVQYRETIQKPVQGVEYKHKKQTGGHGQYGHVYLSVEPCEEEFVFEETIFGGSVPRQFVPAVEKGVNEAMEHGVLAGFPVTNVKVTLTDGSYHSVDSSEMAFKLAASQAFKKAQEMANPIILEPVHKIAVTIPDSFTGDVMSDLTSKRAHVDGMVPLENGFTIIEAMVPAAEIQRYATDLRSITQGRGTFTSEFDHYGEVPAHLTDSIIAARKAKEEALV